MGGWRGRRHIRTRRKAEKDTKREGGQERNMKHERKKLRVGIYQRVGGSFTLDNLKE